MRALCVVLVAGAAWADGNKDIARGYFQAGVALYDQGKYEEALYEFQRAQALSHNAELYFNMAACEEHMDHYQAAAVFLKQYLLERPDAADKENVRARIQALEARDERLHRPEGQPTPVQAQPPPQIPPAPPPAPPPPPPRKPIGGFIALGVTGALAVATIALGSYVVVQHGNLKSACGDTLLGCAQGDIDSLHGAALGTDALIGLTAAAAVATVVVFVVERRHPRSAHAMRTGFAF